MNEERLAVEIRDAFEDVYEPIAGLEERVVAAIPWEEPRRRRFTAPRLAGAFAGALAVALIVALVAPAILSRVNLTLPGSGGIPVSPYYSLAAVSADSLFVVQRGNGPEVLLQSRDGGRSWTSRLHVSDEYDGMQMFGLYGYIWTIATGGTNCNGGKRSPSCQPPTFELTLYRTSDGGITWTGVKTPAIPANGAYFTDAEHGWIDSGSPFTGLGNDVLYATADGGNTWSSVGPLPQSAPMSWVSGVNIYHVTFSNAQRGWYLGNHELFTTADGGHSWTLVRGLDRYPSTTVTYSQPFFSGQDGILPVAYRAASGPDNATANQFEFFVSRDGGATWSDQPRGAPLAPVGDIVSVTILDMTHFWLTSLSLTGGDNVQAGPAVARTNDGGLSWTVTHMPWRILQMSFRDAMHGFALDVTGETNVNGILSTSDAGATWQRVNVPVFT